MPNTNIPRGNELIDAIKSSDIDRALKLIQNGADLSCKDSRFGNTPLNWAAFKGFYTIVEAILENPNGIKTIDLPDHENRTPLYWSTRNGFREIAQYIYNMGAKSDIVTSKGITARMISSSRGLGDIFTNSVTPFSSDIKSNEKPIKNFEFLKNFEFSDYAFNNQSKGANISQMIKDNSCSFKESISSEDFYLSLLNRYGINKTLGINSPSSDYVKSGIQRMYKYMRENTKTRSSPVDASERKIFYTNIAKGTKILSDMVGEASQNGKMQEFELSAFITEFGNVGYDCAIGWRVFIEEHLLGFSDKLEKNAAKAYSRDKIEDHIFQVIGDAKNNVGKKLANEFVDRYYPHIRFGEKPHYISFFKRYLNQKHQYNISVFEDGDNYLKSKGNLEANIQKSADEFMKTANFETRILDDLLEGIREKVSDDKSNTVYFLVVDWANKYFAKNFANNTDNPQTPNGIDVPEQKTPLLDAYSSGITGVQTEVQTEVQSEVQTGVQSEYHDDSSDFMSSRIFEGEYNKQMSLNGVYCMLKDLGLINDIREPKKEPKKEPNKELEHHKPKWSSRIRTFFEKNMNLGKNEPN